MNLTWPFVSIGQIIGVLLLSSGIALTVLLFESCLRTRNTRYSSECPDVEIPPTVSTLLDRLGPSVKIKIKDAPLNKTRAASCGPLCPAYIILSRRLFEKKTSYTEQFDEDDILAVVAHELGHIIPKSRLTTSLWLSLMIVLVIFIGWAWLIYIRVIHSIVWGVLSYILCLWVTWALVKWVLSISRMEEYQADRFAIVQANVSPERFGKWLKKMDFVNAKERTPETQVKCLVRFILQLIFDTHPSVEQRIAAAWNIYKEMQQAGSLQASLPSQSIEENN